MSPDDAGKLITAGVTVTREDIARAKTWLAKSAGGRTHELAEEWLTEQKLVVPREVDTDLPDCEELLAPIARAYSVRLAFYQAVWELVSAGELIPSGAPGDWEASLASRTARGGSGIPLKKVRCSFPRAIERMPFPSGVPADPDIFLQGIACKALHPGIREAIGQALACFRRGLCMPAVAMLAAAAEATWTECGGAVARKLGNTRLEAVVGDPLSSIGKIVLETRKALEHGDAKELLKAAGQPIAKVNDAEVWTTVLRDRRNALHWGKAKSFVADHSETGTLLMAAPLHFGTLEAIRGIC